MIAFHVEGVPATKGSSRAVISRSTGLPVVLAASPKNARDQASWANAVGWACKLAMRGQPPLTGPVRVVINFWLPRRKGDAGNRPTQKRDGDKLERCTWDALTGLAFVDDGQVVSWAGERWFADNRAPGAHITIEPAAPARKSP